MSESAATLTQCLLNLQEEKAVSFVKDNLAPRDVWVVSRDGIPQNVPTLLTSHAILLTVENGKVVGVDYAPRSGPRPGK